MANLQKAIYTVAGVGAYTLCSAFAMIIASAGGDQCEVPVTYKQIIWGACLNVALIAMSTILVRGIATIRRNIYVEFYLIVSVLVSILLSLVALAPAQYCGPTIS